MWKEASMSFAPQQSVSSTTNKKIKLQKKQLVNIWQRK
jgi:hypothetical protein